MAIVGRTKYTRAHEISRRRDARLLDLSRARVYFARATIAIAKIGDYLQSKWAAIQMKGTEQYFPWYRVVKGLCVTRDLSKKWCVTRESSSNIAVIREFAVQPDAW